MATAGSGDGGGLAFRRVTAGDVAAGARAGGWGRVRLGGGSNY